MTCYWREILGNMPKKNKFMAGIHKIKHGDWITRCLSNEWWSNFNFWSTLIEVNCRNKIKRSYKDNGVIINIGHMAPCSVNGIDWIHVLQIRLAIFLQKIYRLNST